MKRWKIWAGILLIFLTGIIIGSAGTALVARHAILSALQEGSPAVSRLVAKRLSSKLDLNVEQQQHMAQTVATIQQQLQQLRRHYQPEAAVIIDNGVRQMKQGLTAKQQQQLDQLYDKIRQRWQIHSQNPQ